MEPLPINSRLASAAAEEPLDLVVTGTFRIEELGMLTTGRIRAGILRQGDVVEVLRPDGQTMRVSVRAIELISGPRLPIGDVGFRLGAEADDFVVQGAVIHGVSKV
jgi:translation elongation factor EF-Tu-like GTPase